MLAEIAIYVERALLHLYDTSDSSNLHLAIFLHTTDDYTCLLHAVVRETYAVQMHIPSLCMYLNSLL